MINVRTAAKLASHLRQCSMAFIWLLALPSCDSGTTIPSPEVRHEAEIVEVYTRIVEFKLSNNRYPTSAEFVAKEGAGSGRFKYFIQQYENKNLPILVDTKPDYKSRTLVFAIHPYPEGLLKFYVNAAEIPNSDALKNNEVLLNALTEALQKVRGT